MPYCQTCGGEHAESDSFCAACGSKVGSAAVEAPVALPVEAPVAPTPTPAPAAAPTYAAPAYAAPAPVYAAAPATYTPAAAKPKGGAGVLIAALAVLVLALYFGIDLMYRTSLYGLVGPAQSLLSIAIVVVATMAIVRCKAAWCVAYRAAFKKYATFSGRADLREFWSFALVNFGLYLFFALPYLGRYTGMYMLNVFYYVSFAYPIYALGAFLPSIAVTVRRLHDTGRSGGWYFISLVPIVGSIVLLVFLLQGSDGENQYSPGARPAYVATQVIPAGWLADPTGRHELRYWDSRAWTAHVSDAGVTSSDAL